MCDGEWCTAIGDWTAWMRAEHLSPDTIALRRYHLHRFAAEMPASPWTHTLDDLTRWLGSHADWKPSTRRSHRASLRAFYSWAHTAERIRSNPAALLPKVVIPRGKPRPAPRNVVIDALSKAPARVRLMVLLALHEGMRRGEVARAHSDDLVAEGDGYALRIRGKGGHVRVVPLVPPVARAIRDLPPGYLFPGKINGHLSPAYVGKLVSRILDGPWTMHTLRHRFATDGHAAGIDVFVLQELLGHASPETTKIYTEIPRGALHRAVMATWERAA